MYKLVLTGATGYIGGNIVQLLGEKYNIYCVVRNESNDEKLRNNNCKVIFYEAERDLYSILESIKPDVVVHLAGVFLGNHDLNNIGNMLDCNIRFSTVFLDAAVKAGCHRIVNTGSYWQNYNGDIYNPVNLYAATKQAFEDILRYYQELENVSAITLTIFDTYGPKDTRKKILNSLMLLRDGESIDMSSGKQKMYFCYIDDVVKAYEVAINRVISLPDGVIEKYSVRANVPISLKEVVEKLIRISGKKININWGARSKRNREIENPEGIGEIVPGWSPTIDIDSGLKLYAESFKG